MFTMSCLPFSQQCTPTKDNLETFVPFDWQYKSFLWVLAKGSWSPEYFSVNFHFNGMTKQWFCIASLQKICRAPNVFHCWKKKSSSKSIFYVWLNCFKLKISIATIPFIPSNVALGNRRRWGFKPQKNLGVDGGNNERCFCLRNNPSYCQGNNVKHWWFTAGTCNHGKCIAMNYLANLIEC